MPADNTGVDLAELVEARNSLKAVQDDLDKAATEFREGGWSGITVWAGSDEEKQVAFAEKDSKATELVDLVSQLVQRQAAERRMSAYGQRPSGDQPNVGNYASGLRPNNMGQWYVNHPDIRGAADLEHAPPIMLPGYASVLFRTADGADPGDRRDPEFAWWAPGINGLLDLVPMTPTDIDQITYLRQSTRTNFGDPVTEPATAIEPGTGSTTPTEQEALRVAGLGYAEELDRDLAEVTSDVADITAYLPVTRKQLRGPSETAEYLDEEGEYTMRRRLEEYLAESDTTNSVGFWRYVSAATPTHVQNYVQARSTDTNVDALYKGMSLVRNAGGVITGAVVAPARLDAIMLAKDANNNYFFGGPMAMGQPRIWGAPLVSTPYIDSTRAAIGIVGDFTGRARIRMRQDVQLEITNGYLDFARRGIYAYLWHVVAGLDVRVPNHFCQVTGLN